MIIYRMIKFRAQDVLIETLTNKCSTLPRSNKDIAFVCKTDIESIFFVGQKILLHLFVIQNTFLMQEFPNKNPILRPILFLAM